MTEREALKLALEALQFKNILNMCGKYSTVDAEKAAIAQTAIKQVLAQPEQEPVAYASDIEFDEETAIIPAEKKGSLGTAGLNIPLYIAPQSKVLGDAYMAGFNMGQKAAEILPPQRKPLTDVTIWNTYKNLWMFHPAEEPRLAGDVLKFARAIEAAHGIKE